jgi:MerR family transcriptional regulator, light-induced transcriptional regulator
MTDPRDVADHVHPADHWEGQCKGSLRYRSDAGSSNRKKSVALSTSELDRLAQTVEAEIIPRLLLAHTIERQLITTDEDTNDEPTASEIEAFARLMLYKDIEEGRLFANRLRVRGVTTERLLLGLLAPTARLLGEYWKSDICDFTQVTVALSRLQLILRELSPLLQATRRGVASQDGQLTEAFRRRALLAAAPGEQHSFGLYVVEEFFRREDWEVWGGVALTPKKIVEVVRNETFDLVGFSLSCERFLDGLASTISAVRKASRNPALAIMVGGQLFIERPELVAEVGADATANDGQQAVINAHELTQRLEQLVPSSRRGN